MRWLFVLFILVPLVEVYLLQTLAKLIDFWPTVGMVLVTGVIGAWLARREGLRVWREWRASLSTFTPPPRGVIDGVLVLAGASLLITPGVLTDLFGILLLVPFTRRLVAVPLRAAIERRLAQGSVGTLRPTQGSAAPGAAASGSVVETEGISVDPRRDDPKPSG